MTASECIDLINSCLRASAIICCACPSDINTCISQDRHILSLLFPFPKMSTILSKMLDLFMEQDDGLMEFLLLHLQTFIKCVQFKIYLFDPHEAFISLQIKLSFDFSVLLDWLMSNETDFLLYFVKYLKYLQTSPERFCDSCKIMGHVKHQVLNELANLKLRIAKLHMKELFPYNPQPLIKNLENVIKLTRL
uniref:Protein Lines N-terminal domain-containing protein n=2 Tax=Ciona intestinalis TaxID=7719 RepID=F6UBD0_CIOIN